MNRKKSTYKILSLLISMAGVLLFSATSLQAQLPGGITGVQVEYWLRADEVQATLPFDGADVPIWQDWSGNNRHFGNNSSVNYRFLPRFKKTAMNYHSAVDFYYDNEIGTTNNRIRKLLSNDKFTAAADRSYFVIWISRVDRGRSDSRATVFGMSTSSSTASGSGNMYGWTNGGRLSHTTDGSSYPHSDTKRNYGIGIAVLPNNGSIRQQQYLNALASSTSMYARELERYLSPSIIGTSSHGETYYNNSFFGDIMEIMVLSKAGTGNTLTTDELKKINTHFAVKYGITLESAQTDYILSDGTSIYNTASTDYTNYKKTIFGIARDDASGLYQKQSMSTDKSNVVVYVGGDLALTNADNTGTLNNNSALMLGTNGVLGSTLYNHSSGAIFQNYTFTGDDKITTFLNYKLKAKVTGVSSFTVNLSPTPGSEWVLVSSDSTFIPTNTRIYKVNNKTAHNLEINDGDYIGFASYEKLPGGINAADYNIEYWLEANEVQASLPLNGNDVQFWLDKSTNGRHFSNPLENPFYPRFKKTAMNFHSAVEFYTDTVPTSANDYMNRRRKLLSDDKFQVDANKSYFVIWISRLEKDISDSDAAVFGLNTYYTNGDYGNQYGWTNNGRLWHKTYYNYEHSSTTERDYGIGIAVLPNNGSIRQEQYLNALASSTSMSARQLRTDLTASVIGTSNITTGYDDYFFGDVMEIMVISRDGTGNTLAADELKKINTHLAVKYGITLNAAQKDYILSDGTIIYDAASSGYTAYNTDIFGIARDDNSGLYQKQSVSTDNPYVTVYMGSTLAETNAMNTAVLENKNALMFGSNGLTGNSSYAYNVGTAFQNYTLQEYVDPSTGKQTLERLSAIFNYKLRAKTTGATSFTVNIAPNIGEWVLVSDDPSFTPSSTRIYRMEGTTVKNVVIDEGDYIAFASYLKAPAGVANGLVMWLDASQRESITLNNAGEVINWKDYAGIGTSFSKLVGNSTPPLYVECDEKMNYHPSVHFRKNREYLSTLKGPFSVSSPEDYTFFTSLNADFNTSSRIYFTSYGSTTRDWEPALGVRRSGTSNTEGRARIYDNGGAGSVDGSSVLFQAGATTNISHTMKKSTYFRMYADGYMEEFSESRAGRDSKLNGPGVLGTGGSTDARNLIGLISEHIAYESELTADERDKVDSYLGLKYATTVDKNKNSTASNFNYKLSNDTSVWNGNDAVHRNFHNNIASVVRDDLSELYNQQARSTDVGTIVHMGVGEVLGCSPSLREITQDYSAITWGHNGATIETISLIGNPDICGELDSKIGRRVWLVDNTNFSQAITVRAEGDFFPYNGSNWQVYMLVADDSTKFASNNWDRAVPMTYYNQGHQAAYTFNKKYTYISFAAKQLPGTCESCSFSGSKKLEFTSSNWARGYLSNTYNLGDGFTARVDVSIESPAQFVYHYPRAYTYRSLRQFRTGGNGTNKMTTHVVLSKAASATFEVYDLDRGSTRYDEVEVYGMCGSSIISPTLSYVDTKERSNYIIQGNRAIANRGSAAYTSRRGRMYVEFETPVEEIFVVHTIAGARFGSGLKIIGVGAMEFICPQPLPEPTEDGLIFTKQGPSSILTCEEANYTFRITNTNCAEYPVNFSDVLPAGMKWVFNSLSVNDSLVALATVNSYGGNDTLRIDNLIVPGGSTLTFRASAVFDEEATSGAYSNQASITYESNLTIGTYVTLKSCDRLSTGCMPTVTNATAPPDRPKNVQLTEFKTNMSCYKEDKTVIVTIKVNNPNTTSFSDTDLEISFNEEFSYTANSLSYSGGTLGTVTNVQGAIFAEGFTIPSGESTITFQIKAPTTDKLILQTDKNGNPILDAKGNPLIEPLDIIIEFASASEDVCSQGALTSLNGAFEIPYCISKECIISNKNVTSKINK